MRPSSSRMPWPMGTNTVTHSLPWASLDRNRSVRTRGAPVTLPFPACWRPARTPTCGGRSAILWPAGALLRPRPPRGPQDTSQKIGQRHACCAGKNLGCRYPCSYGGARRRNASPKIGQRHACCASENRYQPSSAIGPHRSPPLGGAPRPTGARPDRGPQTTAEVSHGRGRAGPRRDSAWPAGGSMT